MKRRVTTILSLFALLILGYAEDKQEAMNSIFVISPYFKHGTWVFDDPRRNLVEPTQSKICSDTKPNRPITNSMTP